MKIFTQEAVILDGQILVPVVFEGVNDPQKFVDAFNSGKGALESNDVADWFTFGLSLVALIKKALKKSK